jgi:hypothetical protein
LHSWLSGRSTEVETFSRSVVCAFDLLADGFDRRVRAQEAVGQRLVLAQQAQQQMLGFDIRTAELAGFVPGEKDDPAGLFGITFKHKRRKFRQQVVNLPNKPDLAIPEIGEFRIREP